MFFKINVFLEGTLKSNLRGKFPFVLKWLYPLLNEGISEGAG